MEQKINGIQSIEEPKRNNFWWDVIYTINGHRFTKSFLDVVKAYTFFNMNKFAYENQRSK